MQREDILVNAEIKNGTDEKLRALAFWLDKVFEVDLHRAMSQTHNFLYPDIEIHDS